MTLGDWLQDYARKQAAQSNVQTQRPRVCHVNIDAVDGFVK